MMLLHDTLERLDVGEGICFHNLTMFPLLGADAGPADYLTLDEALAQKVAHITEVSEGGSVPTLRFVNEGSRPVLLMDGEELVGAKQNRTLNLTILAPAKSTLLLPVTCVEAGRWAHSSAEFAASPRAHYAEARAFKARAVNHSLQHDRGRTADQGEVWADIQAKASRMDAASPTQAMAAMYEQNETGLEEFVRALPAQARQRGAVFAIGAEIVGCDLFDSAATLGKLLPKIVRSYALDALDARRRPQTPSQAVSRPDPRTFLKALALADAQTFPAIGTGEDVRLQGAGLVGGALVAQGRVVHLSAFAVAPEHTETTAGTTLNRASARRRNAQDR